jgi:ATP-dependent helicase/DNAse subunit B
MHEGSLEEISETLKTRLEKLRLHYQITKIEHDHWVSEVSQLKETHRRLVDRLETFTDRKDKQRGERFVSAALEWLHEAQDECERVEFNLKGIKSFVRFLEREI